MKRDIQESLIVALKGALRDLSWDKILPEDLYLDLPADSRFGDLSTNIALRLSKTLQKSPFATAQILRDSINKYLEKSSVKDYVAQVKAEGAGFLNFYFSNKYFYEQLKNIITSPQDALKVDIGKGRKVLIEFVSANPTGSLSVAHARQAAVGDILANILDFCGFKVRREFYLNDEGNQINILGKSVELRIKELSGEKIEFPEDHYQGDYIYEIAKKIKNQKSTLRLRSGLMVSAVEPSKINPSTSLRVDGERSRTIKNQKLITLYRKFYHKEPFVRIREEQDFPKLKDVAHTNFCDIAIKEDSEKIIVVAAIDNLLKGASGQAVQNMNIMYKFPERLGLL